MQKIDGKWLEIFGILITSFLVYDKNKKFWFFEEIFLLANIDIYITFEMLFLILSNIEINFTN